MKKLYHGILVVTVFAIAMAFLESAVVIYLREIMYPEGFQFPLAPVQSDLALTEILREAATLIMLLCIGFLAAKTASQRFAWFLYSFAIWDIFYYVFLWALIGWPETLLTWDILFLIPATWTGPVITPLILTLLMIFFAVIILVFAEKGQDPRIRRVEWLGLVSGALVVVVGFMTDYFRHMLKKFSFGKMLKISNPEVRHHAEDYVPVSFPWLVFVVGTLMITASVMTYFLRLSRENNHH
jgi:hypothetical protein